MEMEIYQLPEEIWVAGPRIEQNIDGFKQTIGLYTSVMPTGGKCTRYIRAMPTPLPLPVPEQPVGLSVAELVEDLAHDADFRDAVFKTDEAYFHLLAHIAVLKLKPYLRHSERQSIDPWLIAALKDAVHFIRNRHNMGRGTREEVRLKVLANAQEALAKAEEQGRRG